jgi:COMPASS component SWD3
VLPAHSDPVSAVCFNVDGTLVASCSFDGLIRIWNTSTAQCLKTIIDESNHPVSYINFSPNGQYLLSSTLESVMKLWSYSTGKCFKVYKGHKNIKYSISTDFVTTTRKQFVISGSEDNLIYLWDLQSMEIVQTLKGHTSKPLPVCRSISVTRILILKSYKGPVIALSSHPKLKMIASGSLEPDLTVCVWVTD